MNLILKMWDEYPISVYHYPYLKG